MEAWFKYIPLLEDGGSEEEVCDFGVGAGARGWGGCQLVLFPVDKTLRSLSLCRSLSLSCSPILWPPPPSHVALFHLFLTHLNRLQMIKKHSPNKEKKKKKHQKIFLELDSILHGVIESCHLCAAGRRLSNLCRLKMTTIMTTTTTTMQQRGRA